MIRVLFVCAGNICRSPIAESFLRRRLLERGVDDALVESAGLIAIPGDVPIPETDRAASAAGLDLSTHRARRLVPAMLGPGVLIYTMEEAQRLEIEAMPGADPSAVHLLGGLLDPPQEIADPIGGSEDVFDQCVRLIDRSVAILARRIEPAE